MKPKAEITPLNHELYHDLSIDELEERLEMDCWAYCVCLLGSYDGGGGGGCNEMPESPE